MNRYDHSTVNGFTQAMKIDGLLSDIMDLAMNILDTVVEIKRLKGEPRRPVVLSDVEEKENEDPEAMPEMASFDVTEDGSATLSQAKYELW